MSKSRQKKKSIQKEINNFNVGKINYWKIATVILFVIALLLVVVNIEYGNGKQINLGQFNISEKDINTINNFAFNINQASQYRLCSIETGDCVNIRR